MSKPNDFRVWSYQDAWTLAMQHIVEGEKIPTSYGSKNLIGVCAGACIYDHGDYLEVYHDDDDKDPWIIYFDVRDSAVHPVKAAPDADAFRNHVQALVKGIETCTASLYKLGEPVEGNKIDEDIHNHIKLMRENYEAQLAKITGLPIEKFNI